jgi:excisionase family DNA binding protein
MATRQSNSLPKRLMTVKEVIKTLSLSESKVYLLLAQREIPSVRIGRSVRVDPSDLSSYIEQCKYQSADFREPS